MAGDLDLGLHTFGDVTNGPGGTPLPMPQVPRNVVAEGVLADQLGLNFFGIGEHHRKDFAVSAPDVVPAAIAVQTGAIRLGRFDLKYSTASNSTALRSRPWYGKSCSGPIPDRGVVPQPTVLRGVRRALSGDIPRDGRPWFG